MPEREPEPQRPVDLDAVRAEIQRYLGEHLEHPIHVQGSQGTYGMYFHDCAELLDRMGLGDVPMRDYRRIFDEETRPHF